MDYSKLAAPSTKLKVKDVADKGVSDRMVLEFG